jgi:ParB-like chromosome segregation protein Spo0J
MKITNRIVELRNVRAADLKANPLNWRTHPERQRAAVTEMLEEIGFADALIAREAGDGTLVLIDGHLRAELADDAVVPVPVLDVSETEAAKLLLTIDPLSAMADLDRAKLDALLVEDDTRGKALNELKDKLAAAAGLLEDTEPPEPSSKEVELTEFTFAHKCGACGFEFN